MKDYEAQEQAYKNGYELGKKIKQERYAEQFIKGFEAATVNQGKVYKFTIEYYYSRHDVNRRKAVVYANTTAEAEEKIKQVDEYEYFENLEFEEILKEQEQE